jgi:hypothetical protein
VSPNEFLVLFEQRTSKELYSDGEHACFAYYYVEKEVACKRQNMWVHLINIKRPKFGIFSHLYPDLLEDEEKFHGFFRMNIEQFYCLSRLVGEEI